MIGLSTSISEVYPGSYREILDCVDKKRGINFRAYRESTMLCRFASRLQTRGMLDYASYWLLLKEMPGEIDALAVTFLISFTQFFSNTFVFVQIQREDLLAGGYAA